jgi:hypothetical protein
MSVTIQVENELKERQPDYVTNNILDCVKFWNNEGMMAIAKNRSGEWGDKDTQKMANTMAADDFLLEMVLRDARAFVNSEFAKNSPDNYECGRTRSHVWIHINDQRVLMIHAGL